MSTTEWNKRVLSAIKAGLPPEAEAALLGALGREWGDPSDDYDALWTAIFGQRGECPHCGQGIFPGFRCWSCEEWVNEAPETASGG